MCTSENQKLQKEVKRLEAFVIKQNKVLNARVGKLEAFIRTVGISQKLTEIENLMLRNLITSI